MYVKSFLWLVLIYFLMYTLNCLMPLSPGDDYLYSFVWTGEQSFWDPLPKDAKLLSSWSDIFNSLYAHYFTHSGRTIIFFPIFFFLWQGKELFNFFNAFLVVLLVIEIYWIADRGKISWNFKFSRLFWIFFALWIFNPGFVEVFLWLTGSLNFLWPTVLLLFFLIPYVRKWHGLKIKWGNSKIFTKIMFLQGLLAGWTNENTICWFILLIGAVTYTFRKDNEKWMLAGLSGLFLGYLLLILAPGNWIRLNEDLITVLPNFEIRLSRSLTILGIAMIFQAGLWLYFLYVTSQKSYSYDNADSQHSFKMAICFAVLSILSDLIMLLSPSFPMRSTFPSLVYLIIAVTILIRLQSETKQISVNHKIKRLLNIIAGCVFVVSVSVTIFGFNLANEYNNQLMAKVAEERENPTGEILKFQKFHYPFFLEDTWLFPLLIIDLNEDENSWVNLNFAYYHGIKGIRIIDKVSE